MVKVFFILHLSVLGLLCRLHSVRPGKLMALSGPTAMSDRCNTLRRQRVVTPASPSVGHINTIHSHM